MNSRRVIILVAQRRKHALANRVGVSFSPAGLLSPYLLGASTMLQEKGVIRDDTILSGASGGALVAVSTALGLDPIRGLEKSIAVACECLEKGTPSTLRRALDKVLEGEFPEDAAERLNNRKGKCILAYTEVHPARKGHLVHHFLDKEDLIQVVRASCNVPFYFNGHTRPTVPVRGAHGVDGYFASHFRRFGCPETFAETEILVLPFHPKDVALRPRVLPIHDDSGVPVHPSRRQRISTVSPTLLSSSEWPFDMFDLIILGLLPPKRKIYQRLVQQHLVSEPDVVTDENRIRVVYQYLFDMGKLSALRWHNDFDMFSSFSS